MAKKTYSEKLLDPRWQQMRLRVFERDDWTCRSCGCKDKTLNAHHPVYRPNSEPWEYEVDELVTLCSECHDDQHACFELSRANALLALVKAGYWNSYDMDCLCDIFSVLTKEDIDQLFVEKVNAN